MLDSVTARRTDIDGLRAIAVVAVFIFHLDPSWLPGGYLGVDVFFTISGYLITRIIIRDLDSQSFSFGNFYERRIRRLLPPLLPVTVFCFFATWFLFLVPEYLDFAKSALAMAGQASNIYFLFTSGYFDNAETVKPLLHTWSLAIEEQFYLFTPFLLYMTRNHFHRQHGLLIGVFICSLGLYALQTLDPDTSLDAVFYNTLTRAWQLAAGASIAFVVRRRPDISMPPSIRVVAFLALVCVLVIGKPAGRTLIDARYLASAFAFILVFPPRVTTDFMGTLLGKWPFQYVGSISYGVYLWHWPLIVFASIVFASNQFVVAPLAIILSFTFATVSLRWIEQPVLRLQRLPTRKDVFRFWIGCTGTFGALSVAIILGNGLPGRLPPEVALAESGISDVNPGWDTCFRPANWEVANIQRLNADDACRIGSPTGKISFILAGDSHANALMPLFDALGKEHGISGVAALYSGCPPLAGVEHPFEVGRSCFQFNEAVSRYVKRHDIPVVFMVAFWNSYLRAHVWDGPRPPTPTPPLMAVGQELPRNSVTVDALFRNALNSTLQRYDGRRVVAIGQTPPHAVSVPQEMVHAAILRRTPAILQISKAVAEARLEPSRSIFNSLRKSSDLLFIDPLPYLCQSGSCEFEMGGQPLYYDDHHPSTYGAMHLKSIIEPVFTLLTRPEGK